MKHLIPQTMAAVSVLALALAVGGCGSSSDDDGMGDMVTEPTPAVMQAECEGRGGRYETDGKCTSVADQIAEAAAAATAKACTDDGGRPEADGKCTSAADVMAEVAMECTAEGGRPEADGKCTSAADLTTEADTAAAATKVTAIAAEADQAVADDRSLGGSAVDPTNADEAYTLEITRDGDGTTVEIKDPQMAGDDDQMFEQAMVDLGDGTTMHVRKLEENDDGEVVEEVVIVSTDIAAPKAVAFAKFETADGMTPQELDVSTDDPIDTFEALNVDQASEAVRALVMADAFSASTAAVLTFARYQEDSDNSMDGNQTIEAFEAAGTYNGAMGTYKCNATNTDCSVTLDADDAITTMSDGWIFTPDADVTTDQPDYDYVNYGFWLKRTTDEDDVLTYNEVETFAGSSVGASSSVTQVTGKATYEGGATGVYVKNVHNPNGTIDTATSGHFTADASLEAHFAQTVDDDTTTGVDEAGQIAPNLVNTLSGTISNFALARGEENTWAVNLQGDIDPGLGTAAGSANGGGAAGTYSATFHGPTADDTQPSSVVGEFDANFSNGSVAGAFGAIKE